MIFIFGFVALFIALLIYSFNYFNLTKPLSETVKADHRNLGIDLRVHYGKYIVPSILVIDVYNISGEKSAADVFRLFLQFANKINDKQFETVELASKGKTKFILTGKYFKQLGIDYEHQNPIYTMRTFPENVYTLDGKNAFSSWSGGVLGVMGKQIDDFNEFHKKWYLEDMIN